MSTIGQDRAPNTMLDSSILSDKVILCCGEDETAVREVLRVAGLRTPIRESDFRSYHVFKYEDVTVILSGIGTGTLEPL